MSINSELPSLMEFVILFQDQHMICTIDTPKVEEISKLIQEAMDSWIEKGEKKVLRINSITGPCYISTPYVFGFYLRPAHESTTEAFQKKLIEMTERQVKAAEKIAGECDHGEEWRE